jgi:hypothetical protein
MEQAGRLVGLFSEFNTLSLFYDFANFPSPQWVAQQYCQFLRQHGQDDIFIDSEPPANNEAAVSAFQEWADLQSENGAYDPTFLLRRDPLDRDRQHLTGRLERRRHHPDERQEREGGPVWPRSPRSARSSSR